MYREKWPQYPSGHYIRSTLYTSFVGNFVNTSNVTLKMHHYRPMLLERVILFQHYFLP